MAIKRPTKSRGTPTRRPVASVAPRHVDLRSKSQMVPGNRYVGWLCKNRSCGVVIAVAPPPARSKAFLAATKGILGLAVGQVVIFDYLFGPAKWPRPV